MDESKKRGATPKPPEEKLHRRAMYLTEAQWAKVDALGLEWLRKLIDRAKPPKQGE